MNAVEIEQAISELAEQPFDTAEFVFQFLIAFGNPETTIKRLRAGNNNKSDIPNGVLQRTNIHIATCGVGEVNSTIAALKASPETTKAKAKFILATDGDEFQAEDLNSGETIACDYAKFANHFGFFLPLAGISTVKQIRENPIDIQATSRLNRLYVELLRNNEDWATAERRHDMNQFMGRLIFCYFAEDTNIFNGDDLFTKTVEQMSDSKSDNTDHVLKELFRAMDTPFNDRSSSDIPRWADAMPYVNGGLFAGTRDVPKFTRAARSYLLHAGNLNWKEINPDIFGSMIQAVADDEERGSLGMHYTSVPNILKVLNPLFLDELRDQLDEAGDNGRKLLNLKKRMARIRVFDPACGSGNFLVIAYKEMRGIEFEVNQRRAEEHIKSEIPLSNFRGIELREFPAEIARLALIIAEFQCDVLYRGQKDALKDFLPLDSKNWIVCGNALRLDWLSICPPTGTTVKHAAGDLFHTPLDQHEIDFENEGGETFICGNPPYVWEKKQTAEQKVELLDAQEQFGTKFKGLDYVVGWFYKFAEYSKNTLSDAAFVATNSVTQGVQVDPLWSGLMENGILISFAYRSFKWQNLAQKNAGVSVVIIGLTRANRNPRKLYDGEECILAKNISPYLLSMQNTWIKPLRQPLNEIAPMSYGSTPICGGGLILRADEAKQLVELAPDSSFFLRDFIGSDEISNGKIRKCLWIEDEFSSNAMDVPQIAKRLNVVRESREKSRRPATREFIDQPHRFAEIRREPGNFIGIQCVSSERREYLTPVLLSHKSIVSNRCFGLYTGSLWYISILSSKLHYCWAETTSGRLETRLNYSNTLTWNTFPLPKLTEKNQADLTRCAEDILLAREVHFPATIADLYNPNEMPENLRAAHDHNDEVLERIYIGRRFKNDTERLEKLFELYTKMTAAPTTHGRTS
ncbi:lactate dehydrogenase [Alphaproteobacteria bacterium]|nr:lactate dehydrogenase [Alphaproteobacteria bacterium]